MNRWLALLGLSVILLASACVQLVSPMFGARPLLLGGIRSNGGAAAAAPTVGLPQDAVAESTALPVAPTPTLARSPLQSASRAAPTPTPTAQIPRQLVSVQRGSIALTLQATGRVSALREVQLTFARSGAVDNVPVQPGQTVQAGQLLMSLDTTDAVNSLSDAQSTLQISQLQLQQLQAKLAAQSRAQRDAAQARQADADRRQQAAQQRVQDATAQAQDQLRQAEANLAKVTAGPAQADRLAAEGAVATAQGALDKAQADLNVLKAGPSQSTILAAQQSVGAAQAAVRKAQADRDKLLAPPDGAAVAAAQRDVADAQAEVARASSTSGGPQGQRLSDAERQQRVTAAQYAVTIAKDKLDALLKGPDKSAVDLANIAVTNAEADLATTQAHLSELQAGPTPDQVTAATNAVQVAQKAFETAKARLDELNSHPTPDELADAQSRVDQASQALERAAQAGDDASAAPADTAPQPQQDDSGPVQILQLQHTVDQQKARVDALQSQISASQLRAPFDGVVESVQAQPGDSVDPRRAVVVFASGDDPIVTANFPDSTSNGGAKVDVGSPVTLQFGNDELTGKVTDVQDADGGQGQTAGIHVDWPAERPVVGSTLQLKLTLLEKDNALIVPTRAIHASGTRKTVDVLDGNQQRQTVEVSVGISSGTDTEITNGLVEGQQVVLPN